MEVTRRAPFGDSPHVGERGANTRRKVLDAALSVFGEHGFHDARVELITSAAGCSRPSFYQYFLSKDEVFWMLAGELARQLGTMSESLVDISEDHAGVQQLQLWVDQLIELQKAYAPVFTSFPAAAGGPSSTTHEPRAVAARLGIAIADAVRGSDGVAPEALGSVTLSVAIQSIHFWQIGLGRLPRQQFVIGFSQTLHRLMHGPIDGVNVVPVFGPPPEQMREWPTIVGHGGQQPPIRRRGRETRERLLTSGARVLFRRGYHDTRVDDIVAESGVSHGSFYRYFNSKDELFHQLAERAATSVAEVVNDFPDPHDQAALHRWLLDYFASYRANGGVISVWQEINWSNAELSQFSLGVALAMFDRLQRIIHRRDFGDSTVDALALLAVFERVPYNTHTLGYSTPDAAIEASAFFLRRALFGVS